MTLHLSHIGLTEDLTFIIAPLLLRDYRKWGFLVVIGFAFLTVVSVLATERYYTSGDIVRGYRYFDAIAQQYFDIVDSHLARYRAQYHCAVIEFDFELSAGQALFDGAFGLYIITSRHTTSCPN